MARYRSENATCLVDAYVRFIFVGSSPSLELVVDVPSSGFGVFAALHHVEGRAPGLYEWRDGALHGPRGVVSRDLVQRLTTGQQPAGAGAITIWVTRRLHVTKPGTYELELIDLGRVGQRLCLAATEMGLGVFVTPAVRDSETLDVLGIDAPVETAIYVFGVGFPAHGQPPLAE